VHVNEREGRGLFDNSFIVNDKKKSFIFFLFSNIDECSYSL
jgi:hypothetical protein